MHQRVVQVFNSHCAPEPPRADSNPSSKAAAALGRLTVAALKEKLKELNEPLDGKKVCVGNHRCVSVNFIEGWC